MRTNEFEPYNFCTNFTDGGSITTLRCYGDNQIINYKYGHNYNCNYILGIKETEQLYSEISLYPNPTDGLINIDDNQNQLQNSIIGINNYLGQTILSLPFTNQIDLSSLQSGMYFLTVGDKIHKKTIKIVKQ